MLEVRSGNRDFGPAVAGELVSLTPAAAPTFATLELRAPHASEVHLSNGWRKGDGGLVSDRAATIRFWVGKPRPIRLRGRARVVSERGRHAARLEVSLGGSRIGAAEISTEPAEFRFELPAHALRVGTNILSLRSRRLAGGVSLRGTLMAFEELILEDAESPQSQPTPRLELMVEGEKGPQRGLQVRRAGPVSFLLHPTDAARHLEVGIVCQGETPTVPPRFRVTAEADRGGETLLEGIASYDFVRRHRAPLGPFAGAPLRLGLELLQLPAGASCIWVEPRVGGDDDRRTQPSPPGLRAPGTNLIVIILDAATRDRFGVYGSEESTTSAIDALVPESLVFDRAFAQASYTVASTASLFTGRLPPVHRVRNTRFQDTPALAPAVPTLAGILADSGYDTAMFTGNPNSVRSELSRGFQDLTQLYLLHPDGVTRAEEFHRPVLDWVEGKADEPFLLYVHYVQPHQPYDAAPKRFYRGLDPSYDGDFDGSNAVMIPLFRRKLEADAHDVEHLRGLYHGNLRYADWAAGELIAELRERGLLERSVLVVTADHGESLGERGVFGHGRTVDRETTPVPLLIRFPSRFGLTGRRDFPVGNVDLMPTLLDLVGAPIPEGIWGRSFLPLLQDPQAGGGPRPLPSWAGAARAGTVAVYGGGFKYSYDSLAGRERLFTVGEEEDGEEVRSSHPVTFDYLAFSSYLPDVVELGRDLPDDGPELDPESLEALRALGYVER